jgi:hypothetical protein
MNFFTPSKLQGRGIGSPSLSIISTWRASVSPALSTAASMVRAAVTTPGKSGNDTLQAEGPACTMAM